MITEHPLEVNYFTYDSSDSAPIVDTSDASSHCHGYSFRSKIGNMSHSTADRRRSDRSSFEKISYDIHLSRLRAAKGTIDSKPPRPHPLTNRADMDQVRFLLILFKNARYGSHHSTGSQTSSTINSPLFPATKTCCH